MKYTARCVCVCGPNSPHIIATKYRKFGDSAELRQLARDVIRWECRPYWTMQPPPLGYFLKLRGVSAVGLPMYRQVVIQSALYLNPKSFKTSIWSKLFKYWFKLNILNTVQSIIQSINQSWTYIAHKRKASNALVR